MTRYLVSGSGSGLGRFLHERLSGVALTRQTTAADWDRLRRAGVDVIVHCAASSAKDVDEHGLRRYLDDNVLLTERLTAIPHALFVLLSSVDVYPKDGAKHREAETLRADAVSGVYGLTKLMSESLVRAACKESLILRASSLLGVHARPSSLKRLVDEPSPALALSGQSRLNCVLHEDVLEFLQAAIARGLRGVYNAAAAAPVTLGEAAVELGRTPQFGDRRYDAGEVDNSKIAAICPAFRRTSLENLTRFARSRTAEAR